MISINYLYFFSSKKLFIALYLVQSSLIVFLFDILEKMKIFILTSVFFVLAFDVQSSVIFKQEPIETTTVIPIVTPSTHVPRTDDKKYLIKGAILIAKASSVLLEIVTDFSITELPSNCFDHNLLITFDITGEGGKKEQATGYLQENSIFITGEQKRTLSCKRIHKYRN